MHITGAANNGSIRRRKDREGTNLSNFSNHSANGEDKVDSLSSIPNPNAAAGIGFFHRSGAYK